jgi:hypothetical protein
VAKAVTSSIYDSHLSTTVSFGKLPGIRRWNALIIIAVQQK